MQNQNSEQKSWWSTLPGMITAFAGIITAITGLILALNQVGFFNKSEEKNKEALTMPASKNNGTEKATSVENKSVATPGAKNIEVKFSMNSIKVNSELEYKILESGVEPKDPQNSILKVKIRCFNNGSYGFNFWNSSFRLLIDDLPVAPTGSLNEVVDGHSAKDGYVEFNFPDDVTSLKFLIFNREDKIEIPLSVNKR